MAEAAGGGAPGGMNVPCAVRCGCVTRGIADPPHPPDVALLLPASACFDRDS